MNIAESIMHVNKKIHIIENNFKVVINDSMNIEHDITIATNEIAANSAMHIFSVCFFIMNFSRIEI